MFELETMKKEYAIYKGAILYCYYRGLVYGRFIRDKFWVSCSRDKKYYFNEAVVIVNEKWLKLKGYEIFSKEKVK